MRYGVLFNYRIGTTADNRMFQLRDKFATNNLCNNKQTAAQLKKFATAANAIITDDRKTAQAYTVVGETLNCVV